jgi:branched-chain amino acid transport system permease protein
MERAEKVALAFFILLGFAPLLIEGYWLRVLTSVLMMTSLVYAQNVLLGYTGYPAFGGIAFFGLGGYTTAVLMIKAGLPFFPALLGGTFLPAVLAYFLAKPLMRLKSHYFAITTLAFQLAMMEAVNNLEFTGGAHGINLPILKADWAWAFFFYCFLSLALISYLINIYIDRSELGWAFKAIREDEVAAETVGIDTVKFKSLSFAIMSAITATAGGIYAYWITYIDPPSMFDPLLSVKVFVALLIGGVGTTVGPFIGSLGLELISEMVWGRFFTLHGVILGILIILGLLLIPGGVVKMRRSNAQGN